MRYILILTALFLFLTMSLAVADDEVTSDESIAAVETDSDASEAVDTVYVNLEPPQPLVEERPPAPNTKSIWVDGYWHWNGVKYVWTKGRWINNPKGNWVAGHWVKTKRGWFWKNGYWNTGPAKVHAKKQWVPGHWRKTHHGKVWVKGHWK